MTNKEKIEIKKELVKAYELAGSTDDKSDVDCLIDRCITLIQERESGAVTAGAWIKQDTEYIYVTILGKNFEKGVSGDDTYYLYLVENKEGKRFEVYENRLFI